MPKIDSYFRSDIGKKRSNNEDFSGAFEPQKGRPLNQSGRLYVIADGMGGHQQGEKASAYAGETLLKIYYEAPEIPPERRLRDILKQVNQNLITYGEKNLPKGELTGTTMVTAVVRNGKLLVANVGDSRAYLLRGGKIRQITRDHSLVGELVRAGTITEAEARQSKYRNRLSRSIGTDPNLEVDIHPLVPLRSGDIILLCTDGLTQYASSQDILDAAHGNAKEIAERLIRFANERGGSDNITALVIQYGKKFAFPAAWPVRKFALIGAGMLMLAAFSFLAWWGASEWDTYPNPTTPTLTASALFTISPTPTASPSSTSTSIMTETVQPSVSETPAPTVSSETATISPLMECEYTVVSGDSTSVIAGKFEVTLDQVFRQDGTQENMSTIYPGEILIIKGILAETCANGGGSIYSGSP